MANEIVNIQGTTLEGGGQLIRIAVGLSAILGIPVHISNIRGRRPRGGGLKTQHLTAVNWLAAASFADTEGAEDKSKTLKFRPTMTEQLTPNTLNSFNIEMSTPGAVTLIFQAILPFIIFSGRWTEPVQVTIRGGTNVSFSPSFDYMEQVLLPTLARIGLPPITARLHSRGWSHGQTEIGSVTLTVTPLSAGSAMKRFELRERGEIKKIRATVLAPRVCNSAFSDHIAHYLQRKGINVPVEVFVQDSLSPKRIYLLLVAESTNGHLLGRDFLFNRKITSPLAIIPEMVKQVADELLDEMGTGRCVDEYMQDQLVIFQAMAQGQSVVDGHEGTEVSLHTQTARWIVEELLGVQFSENGTCDGIGFVAGKGLAAERVTVNSKDANVAKGLEELRINVESQGLE